MFGKCGSPHGSSGRSEAGSPRVSGAAAPIAGRPVYVMAILKNYPCQFSLGMVFLHLFVLGVVAYKQLQYLGLQVGLLDT